MNVSEINSKSMTSISSLTLVDPVAVTHETSKALCGRDNEFRELLNSYHRVKDNRTFEQVVVRGESGIGKTKLVTTLRDYIVREEKECFFCRGKYYRKDTDYEQDPYAEIAAAFSDLCDLILQSEEFNEEKQKRMKEELDTDAEVLRNVITNINPFLEPNDCDPNYISHDIFSTYQSFARLKVALKKFLRVVASSLEYPVILFFDDVQWADQGSSCLLQAMLQDKQIKNVMIIHGERIEESPSTLDLQSTCMKYDVEISLGNLSEESVQDMIIAILSSAKNGGVLSSNLGSLGELAFQRTNGNPFHVLCFIEAIKRQHLLKYDASSSSWTYDLDMIQKETKLSTSLATLIGKKIDRLDRQTKDVLKVASLLGSGFTKECICHLTSDYAEVGKSSATCLRSAVDARFIEERRDGYYQFTHDKLQAAFEEMMEESEKQIIHQMIGRKLLLRSDDIFQYLAATHFNSASSSMKSAYEDRLKIIRANMEASKYCQRKSALVEAAHFLRKGLSFFDPEEKWSTRNFDLSFEMTKSLAKLECILGNFEACMAANQEILTWSRSTKDIIDTLSIDINARIAACAYEEVVAAAKRIFYLLGMKLPKRITPIHLFKKMIEMRKLFDSLKDEGIMSLPSSDVDSAAAIKVLIRVSFYLNQNKRPLMAVYTALLAAEHAVKKGLSPYTANSISFWGIGELIIGNESRAYKLGKLSLKLNAMKPSKDACMLVTWSTIFLVQLRQPVWSVGNEAIPFTLKILNHSLDNGDMISAGFCGLTCCYLRLWSGEHLKSLEKSIRVIHDRLDELGQEVLLEHFKPLLQMILNLRGKDSVNDEQPTMLTGEVMNEQEYLSRLSSSTPPSYSNRLFTAKMLLAYTFGHYQLAETCCSSIILTNYETKSIFSIPYRFYDAMICYARYQQTKCRKYLRQARKARKILQQHHSKGNPNALPYLQVMEAEELLTRTDKNVIVQSRKLFDKAINTQEGFAHLEGLANERASVALAKYDCFGASRNYLEKAKHVYERKWGATMKYHSMSDKFTFSSSACSSMTPSHAF